MFFQKSIKLLHLGILQYILISEDNLSDTKSPRYYVMSCKNVWILLD